MLLWFFVNMYLTFNFEPESKRIMLIFIMLFHVLIAENLMQVITQLEDNNGTHCLELLLTQILIK